MNISPLHINMLLAQMLRAPAVLRLAIEKLDSAFFPMPIVGGDIYQGFMFHLIKEFYRRFQTVPDYLSMAADFQLQVKTVYPSSTSVEATAAMAWLRDFIGGHDGIPSIVSIIDEKSEQYAMEIIVEIHRRCVYEPQVSQVMESAQMSGSYDGIGAQIQALEEQHKGLQGPSDTSADIEMEPALDATVQQRVLTGIPFIDRLCGSGQGPLSPALIGIIAGGGVGKTTLGIQMVVQQAMRGKYAVLVLAEDGKQDIGLRRNLISSCAGISVEVLGQVNDSIPKACAVLGLDFPSVRQRIEALNKFCIIVDIVGKDDDCTILATTLTSLAARGIKPSLCYVDWAGLIANRMVVNGSDGKTFETQNAALQHLTFQLSEYAARFDVLICISQQMSTKDFAKGPFHVHNHYCAADCHMFQALCKYVMVINPVDPRTGLQRFSIPKSRNDPCGSSTLIKRMGALAYFEEATSHVHVGTSKRFIEAAASNKTGFEVPMEKR